MNGSVIGLDVGGTKMAAAWVAPNGRRGPTLRVPVPHEPSPSARGASRPPDAYTLLQAATGLIREASRGAPRPIRAVGVGVPAVLSADRQHIVWAPNLSAWNSFPLGPLLSESLDLPVYIGYDGHMAALGEWWLGAGRGVRHMVLMTLGTGIGGGIIADGRLIEGSTGVAGAFGWMTHPGEPARQAARVGGLEAFAAGPGILRRARQVGDYRTTEEVFHAARRGDAKAAEVIVETARALGMALSNVASILSPELILIGGGISAQADLLLDVIKETVLRHGQPYAARSVRIEKAQLGNEAGILGAAKMALDRLGAFDQEFGRTRG